MVTYMVQRQIEGIGLSGKLGIDLAAARSKEAVARLSPRIEWCHTWVGADDLFSLYRAVGVGDVVEHARLAHLPAGNVARAIAEISSDDEQWQRVFKAGATSLS